MPEAVSQTMADRFFARFHLYFVDFSVLLPTREPTAGFDKICFSYCEKRKKVVSYI
jgi:hypothetical protein